VANHRFCYSKLLKNRAIDWFKQLQQPGNIKEIYILLTQKSEGVIIAKYQNPWSSLML
jgi:hypothetical protein